MALAPTIPDALYIGATAVNRVYQGPARVWPPVATSNYAIEVLADSPVMYLQLDESSGSNAYDSSGNGHNAVAVPNPPTWGIPGPVSNDTAAEFDGISEWMGVPNPTTPLHGLTGLTVEAFIKTPGNANYKQICSRDGASDRHWQFRVEPGGTLAFICVWGGNPNSTSTARVDDDVWHHVAGVWSKADGPVRTYIDGQPAVVGTSTTATGPTANRDVTIGSRDNGREYFPGGIAHVAVYNKALSAARIAAHYNAVT